MQVWGIAGESITFNHPDESESVTCIIENDLMLDGMYQKLKDHANIDILNKASVKDVELKKNNDVNVVTTKNNEEFTCDLVIGADGFNSTVRQIMNVETWSVPYNQMGVVATLKLKLPENDKNEVAWQRFIPGGPIALLPLSDTESSLVWTCDTKTAKELVAMEPGQFVAALNEGLHKPFEIENSFARNIVKISNSLLKVTQSKDLEKPPTVTDVYESSRAMFPLGFSHSSAYVCQGAALIGDAAHRVHPLAGQGVNLGFSDVLKLTTALEQAIYNGSVLNELDYLLKYEQEALKTNVPMMLGVHAIQRMYCSEFPLNIILRNVGLSIANIEVPFKKFFMQKAFA
jgi:ubiquinone biosynthesis monooxygenase Coq6